MQSRLNYLRSVLSEAEVALLNAEYDRFKNGPSADEIADNPQLVYDFQDACDIFDFEHPHHHGVVGALSVLPRSIMRDPAFWVRTLNIYQEIDKHEAKTRAERLESNSKIQAAENRKLNDSVAGVEVHLESVKREAALARETDARNLSDTLEAEAHARHLDAQEQDRLRAEAAEELEGDELADESKADDTSQAQP